MSDVDALDPTTPVVVGVGQASERLDDDGYRGLSEADLAAEAVRAALSDSGVDPDRVAAAVDTVGSIRSFEISSPLSSSPFGRPDVMPAAVAHRVGITARRLIAEAVGGQSPQHLLTELAEEIAAGRSDAFVIAGAEVISTKRHITDGDGPRPDWSEHHDAAVEDRGFGIAGIVTAQEARHGLREPLLQYSVLENARRAREGLSRDDHARSMGELFAPFSAVAAKNPHSASPVERTVGEIADAYQDRTSS